MRGRTLFHCFYPAIKTLTFVLSRTPSWFPQYLLSKLRNFSGLLAMGLRYSTLKSTASYCGINVSVHPGVWLLNVEGLSVGNNVSIHPMCYIDSLGGIQIGSNASIAHGATILSSTHEFSGTHRAIKDQGVRLAATTVSNDVWIGAKCTIVGGVTIGEGCVIGANSVVTHDVPAYSVVAGVPARVLRRRIK